MADEDLWKRRFYLYMGARLIGLLTVIAGIAVTFTDLVREGGWPVVGGMIMVAGLVDMVAAPKLMKTHWRREDEAR